MGKTTYLIMGMIGTIMTMGMSRLRMATTMMTGEGHKDMQEVLIVIPIT